MKAIVNVNKKSDYAKYNGLTFEVVQIMDKLICLNINEVDTDFSFTEVLLIDLEKYYLEEIEYMKESGISGGYEKLKNYIQKNNIKI
jgi:hypothetical protein